jgi:hypothetical protein
MKNLENFKKQFDFEINNNLLVKPYMWVDCSTLAFLENHSLSNKISLGFDDGNAFYEFIDEITFEEAFNLAKELFEAKECCNMFFGIDELDDNEVGEFENYFEK